MTKCKIFTGLSDKSTESTINEWLAANHKINILHMTQSSYAVLGASGQMYTETILTIIYED